MRSKSIRTQSRFVNCMKCPIRVVARARDLYMQSLTGGGFGFSYGNAMGCPTPHINPSASSPFKTAHDDLIISPTLPPHTEPELRRTRSSMPLGGGGGVVVVPRSKTVAYGRIKIEEERGFELGDDDDQIKDNLLLYPRTTSSN